ncbi:TPA: hypothetical protein QCR18_002176 [Bacillus cereus]|uniref:hypothetical protein n=1 Tax=Bacillus cereus group sp. MYBK185-1 TaxID=3450672 RepID=UPI0032F7A8DC|nr:hypothetical protein [Bacillus cereus]
MILRDIKFVLEFNPNKYISEIRKVMKEKKLNEEQATQFYYKEEFQDKAVQIRDESRCISGLYISCLGKYHTSETKEIIIHLVDELSEASLINVDGFIEIQIIFNLEQYISLTNHQKNQILLNIIQRATKSVGDIFEWEYQPFQEAYNKVIEKNYENNYVWKKKVSPGRKYIAEVFCMHEINEYLIYMIVKDYRDKNELKRELLHRVSPHEFMFVPYLGDLKWLSNDSVALIGENPRRQWAVNV